MNMYVKALLFLAAFSLLHFGYEITGWTFLTPFCGVNESVFQHLKMAFWGYILLSAFEYLALKRRIKENLTGFLYSRMLSTIMIPWVIFITWYLLPALYGRAKSLIVDLSWAVAITYISALSTAQIESEVEKIEFSRGTRAIIAALLVVLGFLFTLFTYKLPWIDLFVNPEAL